MIRLTIQAQGTSQEVEADTDVVTVGRVHANTVAIDDQKASREHCRITRRPDGSCELVDLDSRNGTHLNGQRVQKSVLHDGDKIRIGKTTLLVHLDAEPVLPIREPAPPPNKASEHFLLVRVGGQKRGTRTEMSKPATTLGRQPRNDVVVDDPGASNRHARILHTDEGYVLEDEKSRNGTFVNGERVTTAALQHGDEIRIGKTRFRVVDPSVQEEPAPAPIEAAPASPAPPDDTEHDEPAEAVSPLPDEDAPEKPPAPAPSRAWLWTLVASAAVIVAALLVYALAPRSSTTAPIDTHGNLLADHGTFDHATSQAMWRADAGIEGGARDGALHIDGSSAKRLAGYRYAEAIPVEPGATYAVSARVRAERSDDGVAGLLVRWMGDDAWHPQADVLVRPDAGTDAWAVARGQLVPPHWATSLRVGCVARGVDATFDDVAVHKATDEPSTPLFRVAAGSLAVAADTPLLFSLSNDGELATAGAGMLVLPAHGDLAVRAATARVPNGFPKANATAREYTCRMTASLPTADGRQELSAEHSLTASQDQLRLRLRFWSRDDAPVRFAGVDFPVPPTALSHLTLITSSGARPSGKPHAKLSVDGLLGIQWPVGSGGVSVSSPEPFQAQIWQDGPRAHIRLGQAHVTLRPTPMELAFAIRGTGAADQEHLAAALAAARRAVRNRRFAEAMQRYTELAERHPHRRAEFEEVLEQLEQQSQEAAQRATAGLALLERAKLTRRPAHFAAARAALEPLLASLRGTAHEAKLADALAQCRAASQSADAQRSEAAAAALIAAAQRHHRAGRPQAARLHCSEILAQYHDTKTAVQARTLLAAIDAPPPPKAQPPAPGATAPTKTAPAPTSPPATRNP